MGLLRQDRGYFHDVLSDALSMRGPSPTFLDSPVHEIKTNVKASLFKEGRKEMFYLTTHSTHFIYGYMASDIIMVKDHSDSERVNPLPPYIHYPTDRIATTTVFVTPVVEHWLERELAQWVHREESTRRPIAPRANALTTELHL